jgi:outer membrane protein TolC
LSCLSFAVLVGFVPDGAAAPLTADDVVRAALTSSPDAVAAEAEVTAARGVQRSRSVFLANPEIEAQLALGNEGSAGELIQPLSVTGEGWFARRESALRKDAAESDLRHTRLAIAARARQAWADVVLAQRTAAISNEALALAGQVRQAVETRLAAGEASTLDAALARSAEAQAIADSLAARRTVVEALVALAAFHPGAVTDGVAGDPTDAIPSASTSTTSESRADVVAAEARLDAAESALSRARAAAMPTVGVGAFWEQDASTTVGGPKVTLTLPIWTRNQDQVGFERAGRDVAQADLEGLRVRAEAEGRLGGEAATASAPVMARLEGYDALAQEGAGFVTQAFDRGEIDVRETVLFQDELSAGRRAALAAQRESIALQLTALLAAEDPHLLPDGEIP